MVLVGRIEPSYDDGDVDQDHGRVRLSNASLYVPKPILTANRI